MPLAGLTSETARTNTVSGNPSHTPKYLMVRDWIAEQIQSGHLVRGDRLPSEHDFVEKFGVSRVTVRHALDELQQEGMVESHQGQGYFVRGVKVNVDLRQLKGLGELFIPNGIASKSTIIRQETVKATGAAKKNLGLDAGDLVVCLERVRSANHRPICYEERYMLFDVAEKLSTQNIEEDDILSVLENHHDISVSYGDVMIEVVPVSKKIADCLHLTLEDLVIRSEQVVFDSKGRAIDYCIRHSLVDAFRFISRLGR